MVTPLLTHTSLCFNPIYYIELCQLATCHARRWTAVKGLISASTKVDGRCCTNRTSPTVDSKVGDTHSEVVRVNWGGVSIHIDLYLYLYIYMYLYVHIYIYRSIYLSICIYIYILYIHKYISSFSQEASVVSLNSAASHGL